MSRAIILTTTWAVLALGASPAVAIGAARVGHPTSETRAGGSATVVSSSKAKPKAFRCPGASFFFPLYAGTVGELYLDNTWPYASYEGSTTGYETGVDFWATNGVKVAAPVYAPVSGRVTLINAAAESVNIDTAPGKIRNWDVLLSNVKPISVKKVKITPALIRISHSSRCLARKTIV